MDSNYNRFEKKLSKVIDKYYKDRLIKGILLSVTLFLCIFLILSVVEYVSWFPSNIRLILFAFGVSSFLLIFGYFLCIPMIRLLGIFKRISFLSVAKLIEENIDNIDDSIINILELKGDSSHNELVIASIEQKIGKVDSFDFLKAVNYKNNLKFLKHFLIILLVFILLGFINPDIYKEGSGRIINYNLEYIKDVGFNISVDETKLVVEKGDDLEVEIDISGSKVPEELFLVVGGNEFLLRKSNNRKFKYSFKNINQNFKFKIANSVFSSKYFEIKVLAPPVINNYEIKVVYPKYMGLENESFINKSNLKIPIGTECEWNFYGKDIDEVSIFLDSVFYNCSKENDFFSFKYKLLKSCKYNVICKNKDLEKSFLNDSKIIVTPDLFPGINVTYVQDAKNLNVFYFKGLITDDYGFNVLEFVNNSNNIVVPINKNINNQSFYFTYEFEKELALNNKFYFTIWDNDQINGSKSTKSEEFKYKIPDQEELNEFEKIQEKEISEKLEKSALLAEELKRDVNALKERLISEKLTNWEKNQIISDIQNKQKNLEELLNNLVNQNLDKNNKLNTYQKNNEELLKKQEQIQELLESVMDEEIKELLNELEKLKENFDEKKFNELSEKFDFKYDDLAKQLDKNLELLKKYKLEKNIEKIIDDLFNVSKNQEEIADNIKNNQIRDSLLSKNKADLNKIHELNSEFNNIEKENSELEKSMDLQNLDTEFNELSNGLEQLQQDNNSKKEIEQQAKNNSEKSKQLAEKLQQMLQSNQQKQNAENAETLRQILENLFYFSFKQEELNIEFATVSTTNPKFQELSVMQKRLADNYSIIKDSLYALSKRTTYLGNHISKKAFAIENELFTIDDYLDENRIGNVRTQMRYVLQYSNDLILLLSESLKNMDMMGGGGGSSNNNKKKKPNKGKPSLSEMRKSQEGMKEQLQNMINQMKGGGKPSSEQIGKMLAKQEMFQKMISELQNSNSMGVKSSEILKEINRMLDQNRRDLINIDINRNTLNRQKNILTKLLEAETAENERELDDKRKSNEAKNYSISKPENLFDAEEQFSNFNEILNKSNLQLMYFYKNKYQEYINNLKESPDEKRN